MFLSLSFSSSLYLDLLLSLLIHPLIFFSSSPTALVADLSCTVFYSLRFCRISGHCIRFTCLQSIPALFHNPMQTSDILHATKRHLRITLRFCTGIYCGFRLRFSMTCAPQRSVQSEQNGSPDDMQVKASRSHCMQNSLPL